MTAGVFEEKEHLRSITERLIPNGTVVHETGQLLERGLTAKPYAEDESCWR